MTLNRAFIRKLELHKKGKKTSIRVFVFQKYDKF